MRQALMLALAASTLAFAASAQTPKPEYGVPSFDPAPKDKPNFSGKWLAPKPVGKLLAADGKAPPLNEEGKKVYADRQAKLKAGDKKIDPNSDCMLQGEPRLMNAPFPMLILQYGTHVDFVHQTNHTFRIVWFNDKLPDDPDPHWLGWPSAHWDGKTLVIDSTNFNAETWLDNSGLPHGEKLKVTERYTLEGKTIHGLITITDPDFYTRPWTTRLTLTKQPGEDLVPTVCEVDHKM